MGAGLTQTALVVTAFVLTGCAGSDNAPVSQRDRDALGRLFSMDKPVTLKGHTPIVLPERKAPSDLVDNHSEVQTALLPEQQAQADSARNRLTLQEGTGQLVGDPLRPSLSAAPGDDTVSLNFRKAAVEDVVEAVIGGILQENYLIDPSVAGTITLQTSRPIPRSRLLQTLDNALRVNGATLVRQGDFYEIRPEPLGAQGSLAPVEIGRDADNALGFGTRIVPLRYVGAAALKDAITPLVPADATVEADPDRNVLMISGGAGERARVLDLISSFDVDWMAGMSFAILPLHSAGAGAVTAELDSVFETDGPTAGILRFLPLERLNAVLVVSKSPSYLQTVRTWVDTLDQGGSDDGRRFYVYQVLNGQASDLAVMLGGIFDARQQTVGGTSATAPGQAVENLATSIGEGFSEEGISRDIGGGIDASKAADRGKVVISNDRMRIIADDQRNILVIMARPADYQSIASLLRDLDTAPNQVLIEATIAEVALNDELSFGIQWFFESGSYQANFSSFPGGAIAPNGSSASTAASSTSSTTSGGTTTTESSSSQSSILSQTVEQVVPNIFPGANLFFDGVIEGVDSRILLSALDTITDVEVISTPQVMVLNNETAALQVGDQVPIVRQTAVSVQNAGAPQVNSLEYRDTGVILKVTPQVKSSDLVTLAVEQEVSDVVATTTSGIDSPTIQQRRVMSRVAARSGQTVALGGLIRETSRNGSTGLPVLSRIPFLGYLFGRKTQVRARTELLVLITPHVLTDTDDVEAATNELRSRLSTMETMLEQ